VLALNADLDLDVAGAARLEWGRALLASDLRRLRTWLADPVRIVGCRVACQGQNWRIRLLCTVDPAPASSCPGGQGDRSPSSGETLAGLGQARLQSRWRPGDARLRRRLHLAVAAALAEVAESSGLGLRICHWPAAIPGRARAGRPRFYEDFDEGAGR
jgi:hypothetical protein